MPATISQAGFDRLRTLVNEGRLEAAYAFLAERGYHYARWAAGDPGDTIGVPGLAAEACAHLSAMQLAQLRARMASGYLDTLETQFAQGPRITRDVRAEEVADFHGDAFRALGLGIEHWTLHIPLELQEKAGGAEAVERYWQGMLRTVARLQRGVATGAARV
jgi:hypothetical protein